MTDIVTVPPLEKKKNQTSDLRPTFSAHFDESRLSLRHRRKEEITHFSKIWLAFNKIEFLQAAILHSVRTRVLDQKMISKTDLNKADH